MTSAGWWAQHVKSELSQGDIVAPLLIGSPHNPTTYLTRGTTGKNGVPQWASLQKFQVDQGDSMGLGFFLGKGLNNHVLIVSHDCEIDKPKNTTRVLVAPVLSINRIQPEHRERIINQEKFNVIALPDLPDLGTCYADFRLISPVSREAIDVTGMRIASMTDDAVVLLKVQLTSFFGRKANPLP